MGNDMSRGYYRVKCCGATEIDLRRQGLTIIPDKLGNLSNLRVLHVEENRMLALGKDIWPQLQQLEEFHGSKNKFGSIPKEFCQASSLRIVWLDSNNITQLPHEIGHLVRLEELHLPLNSLSSLPASIGNLVHLTELNLDSNQLSSIPDSICKLMNLQSLILSNNKLITLPDNMGELHSLTELLVDSNRLRILPRSLGKLANTMNPREFEADNNPLVYPPKSVVETGWAATAAYMRDPSNKPPNVRDAVRQSADPRTALMSKPSPLKNVRKPKSKDSYSTDNDNDDDDWNRGDDRDYSDYSDRQWSDEYSYDDNDRGYNNNGGGRRYSYSDDSENLL